LTDARYVKPHSKVDARQVALPMYQQVMEKIGKPIVFNVCMLGAVVGLTRVVQPESLMKSLESRIPTGFLDINRKALELGLELAQGVGK
jgi:2-oxoglutarate ferredoxin oxidoreductase subunit gamma